VYVDHPHAEARGGVDSARDRARDVVELQVEEHAIAPFDQPSDH
jgi:hypothetical protein